MIGPNGAGKTTLLNMITGAEQPDAGTLRLGETVQLAYVDQSRDALDGDKTVWEEISGGADQIPLGDRMVNSRAYVAGFNFKGTDQQKKVETLSGGERNRLHLAKLLRTGGNLLLLDEPTNDLDVDTLRALEEALLSSPGARWSSPTTAGSSTASRPTCSRSRATRRSAGSRATSRPTRASATSSSAPTPIALTGSPTRSWFGDRGSASRAARGWRCVSPPSPEPRSTGAAECSGNIDTGMAQGHFEVQPVAAGMGGAPAG